MQFTMIADRPIEKSSSQVRGFFANKFKEHLLLHQHISKNKYSYSYPLIQYKNHQGTSMIIGIKDGVNVIKEIFDKYDSIQLDGQIYHIFEKCLELKKEEFGVCKKHIPYSIITSWLALNEKNYERYQRLGAWGKKKELLKKILIGNIISMSKSLGYTVPAPIEAKIIELKEVPTKLKGTPMLGFLGTFSVNFQIPDYWGIGKSVSRGFGTVKRL